MPVLNNAQIRYSKHDVSKGVAELAKVGAFGFRSCSRRAWGELWAKYLIYDMFDCTGGETLNQAEADCLQGKLSEDLVVNCC